MPKTNINSRNKTSQPSIEPVQLDVVGYYEGYIEEKVKPYPLDEVPYTIKYIPIAFIAPKHLANDPPGIASGWQFDASFVYTQDEIFKGVKSINARNNGQMVLMSLLDTPEFNWNKVNIPVFAKNIVQDAKKNGIKGFNIDAESATPPEQYVNCFIKLIESLRQEAEAISWNDMILSYVCYTEGNNDKQILAKTHEKLDYLTTMAYWDEPDGQEALFNHYAAQMGNRPDKVAIGIKAGNGGDSTDLETVKSCAQFIKNKGYTRMMAWSLTRDVEAITGRPDSTFLQTIVDNLKQPPQPITLMYKKFTRSLPNRDLLSEEKNEKQIKATNRCSVM